MASGRNEMRGYVLSIRSGLALTLLCFSYADAAGIARPGAFNEVSETVHAARDTLYRRGYYDVQLERSSLPYSFNACKRDIRYHIHVDYYGGLVEIEAVGRCYEDATPHATRVAVLLRSLSASRLAAGGIGMRTARRPAHPADVGSPIYDRSHP